MAVNSIKEIRVFPLRRSEAVGDRAKDNRGTDQAVLRCIVESVQMGSDAGIGIAAGYGRKNVRVGRDPNRFIGNTELARSSLEIPGIDVALYHRDAAGVNIKYSPDR